MKSKFELLFIIVGVLIAIVNLIMGVIFTVISFTVPSLFYVAMTPIYFFLFFMFVHDVKYLFVDELYKEEN